MVHVARSICCTITPSDQLQYPTPGSSEWRWRSSECYNDRIIRVLPIRIDNGKTILDRWSVQIYNTVKTAKSISILQICLTKDYSPIRWFYIIAVHYVLPVIVHRPSNALAFCTSLACLTRSTWRVNTAHQGFNAYAIQWLYRRVSLYSKNIRRSFIAFAHLGHLSLF